MHRDCFTTSCSSTPFPSSNQSPCLETKNKRTNTMAWRHPRKTSVILLLAVNRVAHSLSINNGNNNPIQELLSKVRMGDVSASKEQSVAERTQQTLQDLGVASSAEPRTFLPSSVAQLPELLAASMPALFRLGSGAFANGYRISLTPKDPTLYTIAELGDYQIDESTTIAGKLPQNKPLILYDMESCPSCRRVREAVSMLYLTVTFLPCPTKGVHHVPDLESAGIEAPFLADPNTGAELRNTEDIIDYLFRTYGDDTIPTTLAKDSPWVPLSAWMGLLFRLGRGGRAKSSNPPSEPLILWSYEGSPWCKLVREVLCELEIVHTQISCPRGSPNRQSLSDQTGRFQVPYLEDPNKGVALFESEAIIEYLQKQYGVVPSPVKYL